MALVYLHLNRCKVRPNWRRRNSLKQNDVASVLNWENRKKGKHISPKATGVVHDEIRKRRFLSALRERACVRQSYEAKEDKQIIRLSFVQKKL